RIEAADLPPVDHRPAGAAAPADAHGSRSALMKMTVSVAASAPRANRSIGAILMDSGVLSAEDAERILLFQKEHGLRFGEAAIRLGLLTEADLRRPRQHELFLLQNKVGLSTVLSGRSRDEAIIRITDHAGLLVLPAGPVPPNPLELLSRLNFDEFLIHVRASFDMVIIDTPALSTGEDAAMISVRTGAALAVARNGETRVASFNDMVQGLMNAGVAV